MRDHPYVMRGGQRLFWPEHAVILVYNEDRTKALYYERAHGKVHFYTLSPITQKDFPGKIVTDDQEHPQMHDRFFGILGCRRWGVSCWDFSVPPDMLQPQVVRELKNHFGYLLK